MQSRVSSRFAGRGALCFPSQHLVVVLSLVGQIVLVRGIHLILDVIA